MPPNSSKMQLVSPSPQGSPKKDGVHYSFKKDHFPSYIFVSEFAFGRPRPWQVRSTTRISYWSFLNSLILDMLWFWSKFATVRLCHRNFSVSHHCWCPIPGWTRWTDADGVRGDPVLPGTWGTVSSFRKVHQSTSSIIGTGSGGPNSFKIHLCHGLEMLYLVFFDNETCFSLFFHDLGWECETIVVESCVTLVALAPYVSDRQPVNLMEHGPWGGRYVVSWMHPRRDAHTQALSNQSPSPV